MALGVAFDFRVGFNLELNNAWVGFNCGSGIMTQNMSGILATAFYMICIWTKDIIRPALEVTEGILTLSKSRIPI